MQHLFMTHPEAWNAIS